MLTGLIALVVLVLDIIALIDVFKSSMDTTKKVIWVLLILLLPLVGMLLYFVVGKKQA